jgi:hypothetical protein
MLGMVTSRMVSVMRACFRCTIELILRQQRRWSRQLATASRFQLSCNRSNVHWSRLLDTASRFQLSCNRGRAFVVCRFFSRRPACLTCGCLSRCGQLHDDQTSWINETRYFKNSSRRSRQSTIMRSQRSVRIAAKGCKSEASRCCFPN